MSKKVTYADVGDRDLSRLFLEKQEKLQVFRFGSAGSKTRNVKEGRMIRKEIARILTEVGCRKRLV